MKPRQENSENSRKWQSIKADAPGHAPRKEKKPPKEITETYLHNSGLYYLQRYAASIVQFRMIMQRKIDKSCRHHVDQNREECLRLLDALVEKFIRSGLLNDTGFARGSVSSLRRRGLSQRVIFMKLQNKGLSEMQIREALEEFNTENETSPQTLELEAAMKLARKKKYGPYAQGAIFDRKKALATFARAGFSFDVSRKVLELEEEDQ
jgi:regulatory protein